MSKKGLGRGLDALFTPPVVKEDENISEISISEIFPNKFQPRRVFDEEKLSDLAQSIKQYGVLQPIVLRKTLNGYEIVAGERRWRASQLVGLKAIPAVVREYSDGEMTEIALIENIQRQNLNSIEEAQAYKRLMEEFGLTQDEVAQKIGRSRSFIANTIRLLQLSPKVQEYVSRETLTMGQVRPLLALSNEVLQIEIAEKIIEEDLSARDAEELVRRLNSKKQRKSASPRKVLNNEIFVSEAEDKLKLILGTQVKIKTGKVKSKIEIEYYSPDDLDRIIEALTMPNIAATSNRTGSLIV